MESVKDYIMKRIVGEIILSDSPGHTMRRWREIFEVTQLELAEKLGISPSVISDYEGGRRKSPGAIFIKRFVKALLELDEEKGAKIIKRFSPFSRSYSEAVLDLREFPIPITLKELIDALDGELITCKHASSKLIFGYTIIDSIKAIISMSGSEFLQLIGSTSERALIFTNTTTGRSPMVAIRVTPLKPAAVVLHGVKNLDRLAIDLANLEKIPLIISRKESLENLIKSLHNFVKT
ncbi:MAG: helix-turn-helix domain-containing protein [Nitrososphaerota archaeon]|nr:helix-turn-helix domain-containing protein [Nitrososphaerota archaeon]